MSWDYRLHVIVPMANVAEANALAASVDPDTGGNRTFGAVRLSATGNEPATHSGCSTQVRDTGRAQMLQMAQVYTWARVVEGGTFADAVTSLGLKRIEVTP